MSAIGLSCDKCLPRTLQPLLDGSYLGTVEGNYPDVGWKNVIVVKDDIDESCHKLSLSHIVEAAIMLALFIAIGNVIETYWRPATLQRDGNIQTYIVGRDIMIRKYDSRIKQCIYHTIIQVDNGNVTWCNITPTKHSFKNKY